MSSVTPTILWAQRSNATDETKNVIYLTIQVVDPINPSLELTANNLKYKATSPDGKTNYDLNIDFFDEIDPEKSHKNTDSGSHVYLVLRKKTAKEEFWPRLTKEKLKYHYIKTDFDKWVDEDEQDEQAEDEDLSNMMNMGGMEGGMPGMPGMGGAGGMPGMPGMGGAGGMGGMDFSKLMQGMGGGEGAGNFDINALASQLGQAGANLDGINGEDDEEEPEEKVEEVK